MYIYAFSKPLFYWLSCWEFHERFSFRSKLSSSLILFGQYVSISVVNIQVQLEWENLTAHVAFLGWCACESIFWPSLSKPVCDVMVSHKRWKCFLEILRRFCVIYYYRNEGVFVWGYWYMCVSHSCWLDFGERQGTAWHRELKARPFSGSYCVSLFPAFYVDGQCLHYRTSACIS